MHISGSNAVYTIFQGSVKGTGYELHSTVYSFHSRLSRAITFQLQSTLNLQMKALCTLNCVHHHISEDQHCGKLRPGKFLSLFQLLTTEYHFSTELPKSLNTNFVS